MAMSLGWQLVLLRIQIFFPFQLCKHALKCGQSSAVFAHPVLNMELRAFELIDASHQEEIELDHNVNDGFIVALVYDDSTAVRLGISQGDVILSYNGLHDFTLHKLEEFLLSLGWGLLASGDSSWKVGLELVVYDVVRRATRSITYPLEFSNSSERVLPP